MIGMKGSEMTDLSFSYFSSFARCIIYHTTIHRPVILVGIFLILLILDVDTALTSARIIQIIGILHTLQPLFHSFARLKMF